MNQSTIDNWMVELEKERTPKNPTSCPPDMKEKIIKFVHRFQSGTETVNFIRLVEVIAEQKEYFGGYCPKRTTLMSWYRDWKNSKPPDIEIQSPEI